MIGLGLGIGESFEVFGNLCKKLRRALKTKFNNARMECR
jgi:hypothetical protein